MFFIVCGVQQPWHYTLCHVYFYWNQYDVHSSIALIYVHFSKPLNTCAPARVYLTNFKCIICHRNYANHLPVVVYCYDAFMFHLPRSFVFASTLAVPSVCPNKGETTMRMCSTSQQSTDTLSSNIQSPTDLIVCVMYIYWIWTACRLALNPPDLTR